MAIRPLGATRSEVSLVSRPFPPKWCKLVQLTAGGKEDKGHSGVPGMFVYKEISWRPSWEDGPMGLVGPEEFRSLRGRREEDIGT